jgi:hypothetical protein
MNMLAPMDCRTAALFGLPCLPQGGKVAAPDVERNVTKQARAEAEASGAFARFFDVALGPFFDTAETVAEKAREKQKESFLDAFTPSFTTKIILGVVGVAIFALWIRTRA